MDKITNRRGVARPRLSTKIEVIDPLIRTGAKFGVDGKFNPAIAPRLRERDRVRLIEITAQGLGLVDC